MDLAHYLSKSGPLIAWTVFLVAITVAQVLRMTISGIERADWVITVLLGSFWLQWRIELRPNAPN